MSESEDEFVIATGQAALLRKQAKDIEQKFHVLLTIPDEKDDSVIWVKLRGQISSVGKAKAYVKAVCNPECEDNLWLHNLPPCVFMGLQRFWLNWIEYSFGVVIKQEKDNTLMIKGSQMDVTRAISVLQHLENICNFGTGSVQADIKFDDLVRRCADPLASQLLQLQSPLKTALLEMIDEAGKLFNAESIKKANSKRSPGINQLQNPSSIVFEKANPHLKLRNSDQAKPAEISSKAFNEGEGSSSKAKGSSIVRDSAQANFFRKNMKQMGYEDKDIDRVIQKHGALLPYAEAVACLNKLQEEGDEKMEVTEQPHSSTDCIVISDDEEANDSVIFVGEMLGERANTTPTGATTVPCDLPHTLEIEHWLAQHYVGTTSESDCVYKPDMLEHFRKDFDLPEHPDLANDFFSRLSQSIFDRDPSFSNVKSKGTSGKASKRRLVCIKRKTSDSPSTAPAAGKPGILKEWLSSSEFQTMQLSITGKQSSPRQKGNSLLKEWITNDQPNDARRPQPSTTNKQSPSRQENTGVLRDWFNEVKPVQPRSNSKQSPMHMGSRDMELSLRQIENDLAVTKTVPTKEGFRRVDSNPLRPEPSRPVFPNRLQPEPRATFADAAPYRVVPPANQRMSTKEILNMPQLPGSDRLRPIVIDGSNVACSHGNGSTYSCRGIALCVRYFWDRGHREIICFVPNFRKGQKGHPPTTDQFVLFELEKRGIAKFTPSREVKGRPQICYDDRFIVQLAASNGGVIVSNDQYRDLRLENPAWAHTIDNSLLMYAYVGDLFMPPNDPLGRNGPTLDQLLSLTPGQMHRPPAMVSRQPPSHRPHNENHMRPAPPPHTLINQPRQPWRNLRDAPGAGSSSSKLNADRQQVVADLLQIFPDRREAVEGVVRRNPNEWALPVLADKLLQSV